MPFGQVHVPLRRVQVRMSHQFSHAEHVDARFDGPRTIGMPKIIEPEWRFDSAFPQRPLMRWFEFRHRPRPVVPIPAPPRKEILSLCPRNPPIENWKCPGGNRDIANSHIGLPFPDMHIDRGRLDSHVLMTQLKDFAGPQPHLDHDDPDIPEHKRCGLQIFSFLVEGKCSFSSLLMQELHTAAEERTSGDEFLIHSNPEDLPQTG